MMNRLNGKGLIVAGVMMAILAGCTTQHVRISSDPPDARIVIDQEEWRTPAIIALDRGHHTVSVQFEDGSIVEDNIKVRRAYNRHVSYMMRGGGYFFKGVAMPFLGVGTLGTCMLASPGPRSMTYGSGDPIPLEVLIAAASAGGYLIGMPLYALGEYLDDISYVPDVRLHVQSQAADASP